MQKFSRKFSIIFSFLKDRFLTSSLFEPEVIWTACGTNGVEPWFVIWSVRQSWKSLQGIITKGYPFEKKISSLFFNFRQFHRLGLVWLVFERLKNRIRNRLDPNLKIFLSLFSSRIERFKNSKNISPWNRTDKILLK